MKIYEIKKKALKKTQHFEIIFASQTVTILKTERYCLFHSKKSKSTKKIPLQSAREFKKKVFRNVTTEVLFSLMKWKYLKSKKVL